MAEDQGTILLRGRLDGRQRNRLKGLLDMWYSPSELSEEIGFDKNQVYRVYLPLGCPHERDQYKRVLINGKLFAHWYMEQYQRAKVGDQETFCKTCRKAVPILHGEKHKKGALTYVLSICPFCGRRLTKIIDCSRGRR